MSEHDKEKSNRLIKVTDPIAVIFILTGCLLLILYVMPLTAPKTDSSKIWYLSYLNMIIYGLAILAAVKSFQYVLFIAKENHISLRADALAVHMLNQYQEDSIASPSFKQIIDILPNDAYRTTEVGLLIKRILEDARDYIYDPRESILSPYGTELYKKLNVFDSIQSNALRLGILGTFIGLILAISELAVMVGNNDIDNSTQVIDGLTSRRDLFVSLSEQLFSAMRYSFGTSIAGLVVSIYTAMLAAYGKYRVNQTIRNTESAAIAIISLARRATYKDEGILSSFAQIKNSINILKESVQQQMDSATESMKQVSYNVLDQTEQMKHNIKIFTEYQETWQNHITFIKGQQEQSLAISEKQHSVAQDGIEQFKQQVITQQTGLLEEVTQCMQLLSAEKLGQDINHHFAEMNQTLNNQLNNAFGSIEEISHQASEQMNTMGSQLSTQLTDAMKNIETGMVDTGDLLTQRIKDDLSQFTESVKVHNDNKDQLIEVLDKNANYSDALTTQLKKHIPLEQLLNIQDSLKVELNNIFTAQKQLGTSLSELRNHPVHENLFSQISETAFTPLTESLNHSTSKISALENNITMLSKVAYRLDTQLKDLSKNTKNIFEKLTGKSFKLAVVTNALIGTLISCSALSITAYFIYQQLK